MCSRSPTASRRSTSAGSRPTSHGRTSRPARSWSSSRPDIHPTSAVPAHRPQLADSGDIMTDTIDDTEEAGFASDLTQTNTLGEAVQAYIGRVRGGEMGALPSILGLVVLFIVFNFANDRFLSNLNMANLLTQSGSIIILAMGRVLVLLLGGIDLSAGFAGGVSACVMGVLMVEQNQNWVVSVLAALLFGAAIGLTIGLLVAKLGIPSFVVTLAYFLALQ